MSHSASLLATARPAGPVIPSWASGVRVTVALKGAVKTWACGGAVSFLLCSLAESA